MEKDVKAWEHSLRSGLYDGRQANRARPGLNIKPINSRRSLTHRDSVNVCVFLFVVIYSTKTISDCDNKLILNICVMYPLVKQSECHCIDR